MGDHAEEAQTWIDVIATPFDREWRAGQGPRNAAWFRGVDGQRRPALLEELLHIELEYRRRSGETPTAEEYRLRFPEDAKVIDFAFRAGRLSRSGAAPSGSSTGSLGGAAPLRIQRLAE